MDVIRVLPDGVIDQIAAGEVIERPASVVKELVDNAIDAGARTIAIEAAAGGRALRVVDDGCGMSPRDAALALERHATSKLRSADDLWGIRTMGFRGEALPAIASVAKLTVTTRRQGDLGAMRVAVHGGRLEGVGEVGAPVGTCVEVADLFYNVPARLKFLKADATEAAHITELVVRMAMAHPELHLKLRHNGRTALDVPPDRDGFARARALLGERVAQRMIASSGEESGVRVTCYLGAPELAQTTTRSVQLFVGRRGVRDRGLLHALAMGYGELIARGRYPVAIVLVDVPAGAVDVNVHPQKAEVRFADQGAIYAAVRHVVQAGVARAPWRDEVGTAGAVTMSAIASVAPPRLPFEGPATAGAQAYASQLREARGQARLGFEAAGPRAWVQGVKDKVRTSRAAEAGVAARALAAVKQRDLATWASPVQVPFAGQDLRPAGDAAEARCGSIAALEIAHERVSSASAAAREDEAAAAPHDVAQFAHGSAPVAAAGFFGALRYLGQLDLTYLVCEAAGELVLIDQHIAHERVELARLKGQGERPPHGTQRMLFPTTIDVAPALVELAAELASVLAQVGFETEGLGARTLAVKAVPGGIRHGDPADLLRELLLTWSTGGAPSEADRLERVLAEIACHSVVRAGDRLSTSEAEALLRTLDDAAAALSCSAQPHGRPMLLRLPLSEIARRFGR